MKYIIDSSAWIEYLSGSKAGEKVNKIIKKEEIYVISIIISEVISYVKRKKGNVETAYESIIKNAKIMEITPRIAKEAGLLHAEMKEKEIDFPFADSLILCSAKENQTKIITTDNHFKSFKESILI
jgi:predicted nucleic acid-binding protein